MVKLSKGRSEHMKKLHALRKAKKLEILPSTPNAVPPSILEDPNVVENTVTTQHYLDDVIDIISARAEPGPCFRPSMSQLRFQELEAAKVEHLPSTTNTCPVDDCFVGNPVDDSTVEPMEVDTDQDMGLPKFKGNYDVPQRPSYVFEQPEDKEGRRFVSAASIDDAIEKASDHQASCPGSRIRFAHELRNGYRMTRSYFCTKCTYMVSVSTDNENCSLSINEAFPWGLALSAVNYTAATTLMHSLDVPSMSFSAFRKHQRKTFEEISQVTEMSMKLAGEEEKRLAEEAGDYVEVEVDGKLKKLPFIMVIVDGGWSMRAYGHNYNASCGVQIIIGYRTLKVIDMTTRHKNCQTCAIAKKKLVEAKEHECFINFIGPSTAMEADGILESFNRSIEKHGLVYAKYVGDGDSSVYSKVVSAYPPITVEKVECVNHAMRNLRCKLLAIAANQVTGAAAVRIPAEERRIPSLPVQFERITAGIKGAIAYRNKRLLNNPEEHVLLEADIRNILAHVFGEHSNCEEYFCPLNGKRRKEPNVFLEMQKLVLWIPLQAAVNRVATLAKGLIHMQTTNQAESFMSQANKQMNGKRLNLGQSYLYPMKMSAAVIATNVCSFWGATALEMLGKAPSLLWKTVEKKALARRTRKRVKRCVKVAPYRFLKGRHTQDKHYGVNSMNPDVSDDALERAVEGLRVDLKVDVSKQKEISGQTLSQSENPRWFQERQRRVTASMAGRICKIQPKTGTASIIGDITAPSNRKFAATEYGLKHEKDALIAYARFRRIRVDQIKKSGLVVSLENGVFGASPDGVYDDGIIEVKCPPSIEQYDPNTWPSLKEHRRNCPLENAASGVQLKRNHNYYYQVIMQLYVTGASWVDFVVWTPNGLFCERVVRTTKTDKLWEKMRSKLDRFWEAEIAPEIVDSRKARNMPFRHRSYTN